MNKPNLTKVTMNLTDKDVENAEKLTSRLHTRNKAQAVSAALSIASTLSEIVQPGDEITVKKRDGDVGKLIISGINA